MFFISVLSFGQIQNKAIGFIENKGQIVNQKGKPNEAVKYLLNTNGLNVQIKKNGFSYDIYETKKHKLSKKEIAKQNPFPDLLHEKEILPDYKLEYVYHRIDIDFINSNKNVSLISEEKSADYDNYYNVIGKPDGVLNVHKYQQVTYQNIYPNIDVVFSIPKDSLKPVEYNFIVKPNGKISDIQLKFNGVKTELIDNKIKMKVRFGSMEETLPKSWIETGNNKKEITINYKQLKKNVFGFESSDNLENKTLIIDPTPIRLWGTYYGGEREEYTTSLEKDSQGNIYIAGYTSSKDFIATSGAHQVIFGSIALYGPHLFITDGFIAKYDNNGTRLWSTFYGGELDDQIKDIAISSDGSIGFCGNTHSNNNIATANSFKNYKSGSYEEMFLGLLNSDGIRSWATYLGDDSGRSFMNSIVIDSNNNLYVAGTTSAVNFITTVNGFKNYPPTSVYDFDGFICKFSSSGNKIWGTYYGGDGGDFIEDLIIDSSNNIIAVGYTSSISGIASANSYQETLSNYNGSLVNNGLIVSFSISGNRNWGTYFGNGGSYEILRVKNFNNFLYLSGETSSTNFATSNAFEQVNQNINTGCFIAKFDALNQQKTWFTYSTPKVTDIDVNQNEEIYIVGESDYQTVNVATPGAFNPVSNGFVSYIRKINNNCQIIWGTFLGNTGFVNSPFIKYIDNTDTFYIAGICWATNTTLDYGLSTVNSYQSVPYGEHESYINKFKDCLNNLNLGTRNICLNDNLNLTASGGTNYSWTGPNGFLSSEQNPTITNVTTLNSGQYSCTITGTGGCDGTTSTMVSVGDFIKPIPNLATLPTITGDCSTTVSTIPTATDNCAGLINGTTTDPTSYSLPGDYTITWSYNDGNGNIETQTQQITITDVALPTLSTPQNFCVQQNPTLNALAIIGQNIKWYDAQINGNVISNTTVLVNGVTYFASQTINGCESIRVAVLVNIQNTNAPTGTSPQIFCSTQNATLADVVVAGNTIKWYGSATSANYLPLSTILVNGTTYYVSQTINGCESTNRLPVAITLITNLNANNYFKTICDDLNDGFEILDLSNYNTSLLSNTSNCTFDYFNSSLGAENQIQSELINTFSNFNLGLGNKKIYVRITSNNGCFQIVTLELDLVAKPIINIDDIVPICQGSNVSIDAGVGFDSYSWSNGIMGQHTLNFNQAGSYSVTVTQNHSGITCSSTKNFSVVNSNLATISEIITTDWDYNSILVQLAPSSLGNYQYSLDGFTYQNSNYFGNLNAGAYTVYVKDICGITKQDVYLLTYPKFFTPNGDSFNDYWKIKFSIFEPNLQVKIFDRFGKFIAGFASNSEGWDGNYNSEPMPSNDYWFVVTRQNGKEFRGHFALKR